MTRSLEGVLLILLGKGLNVKRGIREMGRVSGRLSYGLLYILNYMGVLNLEFCITSSPGELIVSRKDFLMTALHTHTYIYIYVYPF